jgi:hypothetical protein
MYLNVNFPATGFGQQSAFFDPDLLFDGNYNIISVTLDMDSLDDNNLEDTSILRKGLLLVPYDDGIFYPLDTKDGDLNGATPSQFMEDVVVLARTEHIKYGYIFGGTRRRTVALENRVVPAYLSCSIKSDSVIYNGMSTVEITEAQWQKCQRINVIPTGIQRPTFEEAYVRALRWPRIETVISTYDFG